MLEIDKNGKRGSADVWHLGYLNSMRELDMLVNVPHDS